MVKSDVLPHSLRYGARSLATKWPRQVEVGGEKAALDQHDHGLDHDVSELIGVDEFVTANSAQPLFDEKYHFGVKTLFHAGSDALGVSLRVVFVVVGRRFSVFGLWG